MKTLLCIHRHAGAGHDERSTARMAAALRELLGDGFEVEWRLAKDHAEVLRLTRDFVLGSDARVTIIGGGGGGTARAVVEGVLAAGAAGERARVAFLRLGSGNILARQYGVSRELGAALAGIAENLRRGRTAPCTVMRCELTGLDGSTTVRFAASLVGLGELGHVPADLQRFKTRSGWWHRALGGLVGIERRNHVDYVACFARRLLLALLQPARLATAVVTVDGAPHRLALLAGAVMNFPVRELPLPAGVTVEEPRLTMHLVPRLEAGLRTFRDLVTGGFAGVAYSQRVEPEQTCSIHFTSAAGGAAFLDEDSLPPLRGLDIRPVQGPRVVPGPDYRFSNAVEVAS